MNKGLRGKRDGTEFTQWDRQGRESQQRAALGSGEAGHGDRDPHAGRLLHSPKGLASSVFLLPTLWGGASLGWHPLTPLPASFIFTTVQKGAPLQASPLNFSCTWKDKPLLEAWQGFPFRASQCSAAVIARDPAGTVPMQLPPSIQPSLGLSPSRSRVHQGWLLCQALLKLLKA